MLGNTLLLTLTLAPLSTAPAQEGPPGMILIKGGKKTRMLRDVGYQARTTDFWNSLAAIGGPSTYFVGGTFRDGKGQPGQINAVSHGCPVSHFQNISVLNTGG